MGLIDVTYIGQDGIELDVLTTQQIRGLRDINNNAMIFRPNPTGKFSASNRRLFPSLETEFELLLNDRDDVDEFKTFLDTRKGRRIPFYMPTWTKDMMMTDDNASALLKIRNIGYTDNYFSATVLARNLIIFMNPGDSEYEVRLISGSSEIANDREQLTMNSILPVDKRATDYWEIISFLNYCRLAQDGADLIWHQTDDEKSERATIRLRIKVLESIDGTEP